MSLQSETRAWAVALAAVFCLSAIGYSALKLPDLSPTVSRANTALDTLNRPCKGVSCGTLASVDKVIVKIGDIAVDTQMQVRQSGTLINAASESLASTSRHLDAAIDTANTQLTHLGPLLDAGRDAAASVAPAMQSLQPVLANADGAVGDFRRFLTAPALNASISNVDSMTAAWARISTNGARVTDKMTADYFKPVPWYLYPVKKGSELLDIGAAVARHTP
jgi:hypothetical protein